MQISLDTKSLIKYLTSSLGATLVITVVIGILFLCISGFSGSLKMVFWTFIIVFPIIWLNNEYLFTQFEEKKIPGNFPIPKNNEINDQSSNASVSSN